MCNKGRKIGLILRAIHNEINVLRLGIFAPSLGTDAGCKRLRRDEDAALRDFHYRTDRISL